jgi:hypothetical protein
LARDAFGRRRSVDISAALAIAILSPELKRCKAIVSSVIATTRPTNLLSAGVVADTRAMSPG